MFKNIHINLINGQLLYELLEVRSYHITYDDAFEQTPSYKCQICEAVACVCTNFSLYNFDSAIITDATTGEILAEVKRVDEDAEDLFE